MDICVAVGGDKIVQSYCTRAGIPQVHYNFASAEELIKTFVRDVDFLLLKIDDGTPQWQKNLLMRFKGAGKHGKVIK